MSRLVAYSAAFLFLICTGAQAYDFPSYEFDLAGDQIRAKFIVVGFPAIVDGDSTGNVAGDSIFENRQMNAITQIDEYLTSHSNGMLTFTDDSGLLFHFGGGFDDDPENPDETALAWIAEFGPEAYVDGSTLGPGYEYYDEVNGWWYDGRLENFATHLYAEILWKIYEEYSVNHGVDDLFADDGGLPWTLFFLFMNEGLGHPSTWPHGPFNSGVGGRPDISVYAPAVVDSTGNFYSHLKRSISDSAFAGAGQNIWNFLYLSGGDPVAPEVASESTARVVLHEFVHTLGPRDGPPNISSSEYKYHEGRYYYGNLNLMCQHWDQGMGIPPISDQWLMVVPWNRGPDNHTATPGSSVVDLTGLDVRGHRIDDVRAGGQLAKFSIGQFVHNGEVQDEYFVLAYHAGSGLDIQDPDENGVPIVPSQGLAIWHCIGDPRDNLEVELCDLESPIGLWTYGYPDPQLEFLPPNHPLCIAELAEDKERGYDNYDLWAVIADAEDDSASHFRANYSDYKGDVFDFFRNDLEGWAEYPGFPGYDYNLEALNADEFSFATNPNTYGYSHDPESAEHLRRRPQDDPNSYVVKIGEPSADGSYITIDLSPGPWEEVVFPPPGVTEIASGSTVPIGWGNEYDQYIESVDIEYSRNFGHSWIVLVSGYDDPDEDHKWLWYVDPDAHPTIAPGGGRIRITYHNNITDQVATEKSGTPFTVTGLPAEVEQIIFPAGGDVVYRGLTTTLRWTRDMSDPWQFRLRWRHGESGTIYEEEDLLAWTYDQDLDEYNAEWTPRTEHVGPEVQFQLVCYSHVSTTTYSPWTAPFPVYPLGSSFTDVTDSALTDADDWYDGIPAGAIPIDYLADDLEDFLVTMSVENEEDAGALLYRNVSQQTGTMLFTKVQTLDAFPSGVPLELSTSATCADLDQDGDRDLIIGMAGYIGDPNDGGERGARIYRNDGVGGFVDATDQYVAPPLQNALIGAKSASVIDVGHNGMEDIFIAASIGTGSDATGDIFLVQQSSDPPSFVQQPWGHTIGSNETAWADADADGYWEFFCLEGAGYARYFEQQANGRFDDFTAAVSQLPLAVAACWADLDHTNNLDLVVATQTEGIYVLWGTSDDGGQVFSESERIPVPMFWQPSGIAAVDHDQDGWCDLVVTGAGDDDPPLLVMNLMGNPDFPDPFAVVDERSGLAALGAQASHGLAAADFDGDHDVDLMLPRDDLSGRANQSKTRNGAEPPANWIAFDFEPDGGSSGVSIMGSVVVVEDLSGNELGRRVLDGGGGPSGQDSGLLIVGLGDHTGDVQYLMHMPLDDFGPITTPPDTVIQITVSRQTGTPAVYDVNRSVDVIAATGLLEWRFQWTTDRWTPPENDRVHIWDTDCPLDCHCTFEDVWLDSESPDTEVTVTYRVNAATGEREYVHLVVWTDQPCSVGCNYELEVFSKTADDPPLTGEPGITSTGRLKVCPQSY